MRPVKANKRMRQLIYIMMVMALLSSCQQKGDKNMTSEELMRKAIVLAEENVDNGGGPFGAVIARNGEIIATGVNRVTAEHDPTAHAEVSAIRAACKNWAHLICPVARYILHVSLVLCVWAQSIGLISTRCTMVTTKPMPSVSVLTIHSFMKKSLFRLKAEDCLLRGC